jgi:hypothetical protein
MWGQGWQIRRIRKVTGPRDTPGEGVGRFMPQIYYRGPHREVHACVTKGFAELIFCADIPLYPGNEQGLNYSVRNARLALTCTAAFRFLVSRQ